MIPKFWFPSKIAIISNSFCQINFRSCNSNEGYSTESFDLQVLMIHLVLPIFSNVERDESSIMRARIQKLFNPSFECVGIQWLYARVPVNPSLPVLQRSLLGCVSLKAENKEEADSDEM